MKNFKKTFLLSFLIILITTATKSFAISTDFIYAHRYIKSVGENLTPYLMIVKVKDQSLYLFKNNKKVGKFLISTSKRGIGQIIGSKKTPIGLHKVEKKFGHNVPDYGIFKAKQFTGRVWNKNTPRSSHRRDHIVTRILTLQGLEPGLNKGYNNKKIKVDSKDRLIYIHGTTMEWKLGKPATIGCIHLSSKDIKKLFNVVPTGTLVLITP